MARIVEPLGREAQRQRVLVQIAYFLSSEIRRRAKKLKKGDGKNAE